MIFYLSEVGPMPGTILHCPQCHLHFHFTFTIFRRIWRAGMYMLILPLRDFVRGRREKYPDFLNLNSMVFPELQFSGLCTITYGPWKAATRQVMYEVSHEPLGLMAVTWWRESQRHGWCSIFLICVFFTFIFRFWGGMNKKLRINVLFWRLFPKMKIDRKHRFPSSLPEYILTTLKV